MSEGMKKIHEMLNSDIVAANAEEQTIVEACVMVLAALLDRREGYELHGDMDTGKHVYKLVVTKEKR